MSDCRDCEGLVECGFVTPTAPCGNCKDYRQKSVSCAPFAFSRKQGRAIEISVEDCDIISID